MPIAAVYCYYCTRPCNQHIRLYCFQDSITSSHKNNDISVMIPILSRDRYANVVKVL